MTHGIPDRDQTFWLTMCCIVAVLLVFGSLVLWFAGDCSTLESMAWSAGDLPTRCVEVKR